MGLTAAHRRDKGQSIPSRTQLSWSAFFLKLQRRLHFKEPGDSFLSSEAQAGAILLVLFLKGPISQPSLLQPNICFTVNSAIFPACFSWGPILCATRSSEHAAGKVTKPCEYSLTWQGGWSSNALASHVCVTSGANLRKEPGPLASPPVQGQY